MGTSSHDLIMGCQWLRPRQSLTARQSEERIYPPARIARFALASGLSARGPSPPAIRSHLHSHCLRSTSARWVSLLLDHLPGVEHLHATSSPKTNCSDRETEDHMFHQLCIDKRVRLDSDSLCRSPSRCLSITATACMQFGVLPLLMTARTGRPAASDALRRVWILLLVTACGLACEVPASATEVWVITDREHPIQVTPGVRLIELDAPARIKAELSSKLPSDPAQASLIVQQRLKHGGAELQERLARAHQGVIDAWSLGVTKVPAIVVDRRYIVYGETDTLRALACVENYRRRMQK